MNHPKAHFLLIIIPKKILFTVECRLFLCWSCSLKRRILAVRIYWSWLWCLRIILRVKFTFSCIDWSIMLVLLQLISCSFLCWFLNCFTHLSRLISLLYHICQLCKLSLIPYFNFQTSLTILVHSFFIIWINNLLSSIKCKFYIFSFTS